MKKIATLITTVVMSIFFCTSFFIDLSAAAAATEGSSGGGGHRGDYVELNRAPIDTELTEAQINANFIDDFRNNLGDSMSDFFYYCLGTVGAVFSDDTTVKSVQNQYNAIYANALSSPEEMRKIFYYGTDGQLYFTDDFLSNFRSLSDKASYEQGVVAVPGCTNDKVIQYYTGIGALYLTNGITNGLNGNAPMFMRGLGLTSANTWMSPIDISPFGLVCNFSTFAAYQNYCSGASSGHGNLCLYNLSSFQAESITVDTFSADKSSDGSFLSKLSTTISGGEIRNCEPNITRQRDYNNYLFYSGTVECFTNLDYLKFYSSGGTGVIRGNTYYALDNAQNLDDIMGKDWKTYYQGLQKQYKQLAGEVASGNKTLKEINETLSKDILDSVADVAQSVTQQTNYLKKILDEVKSISSKLTYSNVVGTVSAASNLLSAICDGLDSLFGGEEGGVFSLLDFVENYVLDGAGNTAASIMKKSFPFSVPHDFYLILELFSVDAKVPQINFSFDLKRLGLSYDYSYTANDFEKLAYMTRFFSSVGFVMVLINLTNKILKK